MSLEDKEETFQWICNNSPHLWECCGVTLAPGCAHRCREPGAKCRGPCTQWSLFLGGHSAAGLWVLWQLRRDQSRTWAAPSRPTVSQSRTEHNHTGTMSSNLNEQDGNSRNLHKCNGNLQARPCAVVCGCCWVSFVKLPIECYWKTACIHEVGE